MKETQPLVDLLPGAGVTGVRKVVDSGWCFWTVAVALADGGALVYSPTDGLSAEGHAALPAPRYLLAPNHFHHMGLRSWLTRDPQARAFTSVLVPSHGDVARGPDLSERLTRLVHERL